LIATAAMWFSSRVGIVALVDEATGIRPSARRTLYENTSN